MKVEVLKEKFLGSIDMWLEERIDEMLKDNPALAVPSVYMKRGCHNIVKRYRKNIGDSIDKASLFFTDEEGNVDANTLFEDMLNIFKGVKESSFDTGFLKGTIGNGKISLELPDNIFMNIIFGNKKTITFDCDDFLELKALLVD